jgi:hypothetical protein
MPDTTPNSAGRPEPIDPEQLTRLLELELIQKRAQWKQAGARSRSIRTNSFVFLFILVVGCIVAFVFLFSKVNEKRASHLPEAQPSASEQ